MTTMKVIKEISAFKQLRDKNIGFVPTMGCLHKGHVSLIKKAQAENEIVVVSIFINPTQFNNVNDFKHYPQTLEQDLALLKSLGVEYVFIPSKEMMYPRDNQFSLITTDPLATICEGVYRPGHYSGVLTVVMKLFNIVRPQRAYFGEKDLQQVLLIQHMVESYFMDIEVIACPTVRDHSKLPFSSRNNRLNPEQRQRADLFAKIFHSETTPDEMVEHLNAHNIKVDYITQHNDYLLAAVWVDDIRLIDCRSYFSLKNPV